jgi:hypothetical protein
MYETAEEVERLVGYAAGREALLTSRGIGTG